MKTLNDTLNDTRYELRPIKESEGDDLTFPKILPILKQ